VPKIFDLHCDVAQNVSKGKDLSKNTKCHVDIPKLKKGCIFGLVWACWVSPKSKEPFFKALKLIDSSIDFISRNRRFLNFVRSYDELRDDRVNIVLGVEGGHIYDQSIVQFRTLYNLGVRVFTLTWNNSNRLAHSALDNDNQGLTKLGCEYIKSMAKTGVLLDLSHASTKTVIDTCRITALPPIASHSCVRTLNGFMRNISDDALKAIWRRGGVCGVNFSSYHLGQHKIVDHLRYIKQLTSIGTVAIGSDFDGITDPVLPDISFSKKLTQDMVKSGFTTSEIEKVFYKNFLQLFRKIC